MIHHPHIPDPPPKSVVSKGPHSRSDTRGLVKLRDAAGSRFASGVVIHAGEQTLPLGDRLWAVPISGLWQG